MGLFGKKEERNKQDNYRQGNFPNMDPQNPGPQMQQEPYQNQGYGYQDMPGMDQGQATQQDYGQYGQQQMQDPYGQQQEMDTGQVPEPPGHDYGQRNFQDDTKERVEEIAEAIIDEKWNELIKDINKVIEWKERTDNEIKKMEQEITNLKERFESLHKGILGKITEYDQNLTNVGTEIKAMDKVFQKILPTFTENVNKLDRLIKGRNNAR
ncbi:hypothetical protein GF323_06185 [Candidatus Woesearchaeota archaeon]|nr:hypothetical protein [Candidatus Woesearchaeota archaeon]